MEIKENIISSGINLTKPEVIKPNLEYDKTALNVDSKYHAVLLTLTRSDSVDLDSYLNIICKTSALTLGIKRVSIWFINDTKDAIERKGLYWDNTEGKADIKRLSTKNYINYFNASKNIRILLAKDAVNNLLTKEFSESYLKPLGITSTMDVPVWLNSKVIGMICYENIGPLRDWTIEEQDFGAVTAELISRAFEANVSEKKEAELTESQRFLSTLISNLSGYVYRVDKIKNEWEITYMSDGVYDLTGFKPEELMEKDNLYYGSMVFQEDSSAMRKIVAKALVEKRPYQINYRIRSKEGKIKWVWEQGRGIFNEQGNLAATEGFITDITEKKLAEEEILKRNEELYIINQIGQSLTKLATPLEIVKVIHSMLARLFDVNNLSIALYDEAENLIYFPSYTVNGKEISTPKRTFGNGLTEYIITTKQTVLANTDIKRMFKSLSVKYLGKDCKSLMAVPMIAAEKVIGVIAMQDYVNENAFTDSNADILKTIASQAAIALENSRLYSEVQKELEERSKTEQKITKSLKEKEILLQEVHHRVKNNLQIMSSLMKLQSKFISDPKILEIFKESENRIKSMAIVHSKLYNRKDYEKIDFGDYVKSLSDNFHTTYGMKLKNISIVNDIDKIELNIDTAIPCGLIINELVSNAIKYAFPDNIPGEIFISMKEDDEISYTLIVRDNGVGMPAGIDIKKSQSLGLQLVTLLTGQLTGTVKINIANGTEFKINFHEAVYKQRE